MQLWIMNENWSFKKDHKSIKTVHMAHMHHISNLLKSRIALCEEQADIEVVSEKLFLIRELFAEAKYKRVFF